MAVLAKLYISLISTSKKRLAMSSAKPKIIPYKKESLKCAINLDAAILIANKAGFEISKGDWIKYQEKQAMG